MLPGAGSAIKSLGQCCRNNLGNIHRIELLQHVCRYWYPGSESRKRKNHERGERGGFSPSFLRVPSCPNRKPLNQGKVLETPGYTCNRLRLLSQSSFEDVELLVRIENCRCSHSLLLTAFFTATEGQESCPDFRCQLLQLYVCHHNFSWYSSVLFFFMSHIVISDPLA